MVGLRELTPTGPAAGVLEKVLEGSRQGRFWGVLGRPTNTLPGENPFSPPGTDSEGVDTGGTEDRRDATPSSRPQRVRGEGDQTQGRGGWSQVWTETRVSRVKSLKILSTRKVVGWTETV